MLRTSQRKQVLKQLEQIIKRRKVEAAYQSLLFEDSDNEGEIFGHDGSLHAVMDVMIQAAYDSISSRRYLFDRKPYRKGNSKLIFERDLQEDDGPDGTPPWLTDEEFLHKYRMHRDSFKMIVSLINNHPAFQSKGRKKQAPVAHQLMVFLYNSSLLSLITILESNIRSPFFNIFIRPYVSIAQLHIDGIFCNLSIETENNFNTARDHTPLS